MKGINHYIIINVESVNVCTDEGAQLYNNNQKERKPKQNIRTKNRDAHTEKTIASISIYIYIQSTNKNIRNVLKLFDCDSSKMMNDWWQLTENHYIQLREFIFMPEKPSRIIRQFPCI